MIQFRAHQDARPSNNTDKQILTPAFIEHPIPTRTLSSSHKPAKHPSVLTNNSRTPTSAVLRQKKVCAFLPLSSYVSKQTISPEPHDAIPVEVDDIVAAAAGHTTHPSALISSLFAGAGLVAGATTILGLYTARMAYKSLSRIKFQIKSLNLREREDRHKLQGGKHNRSILVDRLKNTEVLLKERKAAFKSQKERFTSSLIMSFGTGAQFLGILSSGALFGSYTGTLFLSPILLGIGLLTISAYSGWSTIKKIKELSETMRELPNKGLITHETAQFLTAFKQKKILITALGTLADAMLSGGTLIAGLSSLGAIIAPAGLAITGIIFISAGVSGLITHYLAEHGYLSFQPSIGLKKRFLGSYSDIEESLTYLKESSKLIKKLAYSPTEQSLFSYLKAHQCLDHKEAHSLNSSNCLKAMFEHLHRNELLNKTLKSIAKRVDHNTLDILTEQSRQGIKFDLNIQNLSGEHLRPIIQAGIKTIVSDLKKRRDHQTKEIVDHLMRRLESDKQESSPSSRSDALLPSVVA